MKVYQKRFVIIDLIVDNIRDLLKINKTITAIHIIIKIVCMEEKKVKEENLPLHLVMEIQ